MKKKQRLAFVMILTLVLAVIAPAGLPVYGDTGGATPTNHSFSINEGNITLRAGTGEYTGMIAVTHNTPSVTKHVYANDSITITGITGTTTTNRIVVASGVTANITLSNVNISIAAINGCAFDMTGATVNLILAGNNTLSSGLLQSGLKAPAGAILTIDGTGSLVARSGAGSSSAGIGGGHNQSGGVINILGGEITAIGGNSGAGIGGGGGSGSNGGTINISGGTVTGTGGDYGAGIGGGASTSNGSTINITGGSITAQGGRAAAGIGGGLNGGSGIINISGDAWVSATGGGPILERQNGWDIGSGSDTSNNGTLRIQGSGSKNPTVIFTTYGTDTLIPSGVEKPYTNCTIEGNGAKDKWGIDIAGIYGPEGKEQASLIINGVPSSMKVGESLNLSNLVSGGSTLGGFTYIVSGSGVTVDAEGTVTAVQEGTATITVIKEGNKYFSPISAVIDPIEVTEPVILESLEIRELPTKRTYHTNDILDLVGLVVIGNYSSNTTVILSINESHISGFNSSRLEESQVLTVSYGGKTITFTVDIVVPPAPILYPVFFNYDVAAPADIFTTITWGTAASVTDVFYGSHNLTSGRDYSIKGDNLTIYVNYLKTLNLKPGDKAVFNILFDDNNKLTLTVNGIEGYIPSNNSNLKALTLSAGTLYPSFSQDIVTYSTRVGSEIDSINITPVTADKNATVTINEVSIASGNPISISLNTGNNSIIIRVTAEDGSSKTYIIEITRASASDTSSGGGGGSGSGSSSLRLSNTNPIQGTIGSPYSHSLRATGGSGGYSFEVTSGKLPEGLTLSKDGVISGTPTKAGAYQYNITVTDRNGRVASHSFTQIIEEGAEASKQETPEGEGTPKKQIRLTIGKLETKIEDETYLLDAIPFVDSTSNRTLVPLKFISEALGATVTWLPETEQILITEGEQEILLTIGSKEVLVNGEIILIEAEPKIMPPGRTFVPLRFVSEILGATVEYDEVTREIRIEK